LGHHDEAALAFTRALEINPGFTDAMYHKGLALAELGEFSNAVKAFPVHSRLNRGSPMHG